MRLFKKTYKTEEDIVLGCIKQKRLAQEKLYLMFSKKMMSICIRYVKDIEEAEECLSNAFIKIFQNINVKKENTSLEGWIRKIVVNECLQNIRKRKNNFLYLDDLSKEPVKNEPELHYEQDDIFKAIQELPSGYRTVFNLYAIENYKHQEISEALNISINTSKSQYSKAKKMLKSMLENSKPIKQKNHENSI